MADFKVYDNSKEYIDAVNKAADKILEEIGIEMERAAKKHIRYTIFGVSFNKNLC